MKESLQQLLLSLSQFIEATTGVCPPPHTFKPATGGRLGLSTFVRGDAPAAAKALNANCIHCLWEDVPVLAGVEEKNGWLLLHFSPDFWEKLLKLGQSLPPASPKSYWGNRLHILCRKGDAPCPEEPRVLETLLLCFWAWGTERYPKNLPERLLTPTHVSPPTARLELENQCGTVARALLGFMSPTGGVKSEE